VYAYRSLRTLLIAGSLALPAAGAAAVSFDPKSPDEALDLEEVRKRIADPTRTALDEISFTFFHPAVDGAPASARTAFRCLWTREPERTAVTPVDPVPAFRDMKDQFTRILDYVWRFGGPQAVLRERMESAAKTEDGVTVRLVATDIRKSWQLHFREEQGKLVLARATSQEFGSVDLEYAPLHGVSLVSRMTVDDPKRPTGKFTLEFQDLTAKSGSSDR
jgi:hypothetical protein